jgi:hypothetical protein
VHLQDKFSKIQSASAEAGTRVARRNFCDADAGHRGGPEVFMACSGPTHGLRQGHGRQGSNPLAGVCSSTCAALPHYGCGPQVCDASSPAMVVAQRSPVSTLLRHGCAPAPPKCVMPPSSPAMAAVRRSFRAPHAFTASASTTVSVASTVGYACGPETAEGSGAGAAAAHR